MLSIGLATLIVIGAVGGWWCYYSAHRAEKVAGAEASKPKHSPPADPRLTFATPFLNVRPEVKYVGDETCAGCHEGHAKSFRQHPMGRSLEPIAAATAVERYDASSGNPFTAGNLRYEIERAGERVLHKETATDASGRQLWQQEAEVQFALGSGERGRSYLLNQDGFLFQSPITWYPLKGKWDLSPGYDASNAHFSRPITHGCLFCHANRAQYDSQTNNHYASPIFQGYAIGCERCHGPGELHVQARRAGEKITGVDHTIVNPRHLEHSLRESVCQQCHLQGEQRVLSRGRDYFDFRPGLPLALFIRDFVRPPDQQEKNKFVGTVEQMYASRCFEKSSGADKLGCISCHDPHEKPAADKKVAYYRERCLSCHAQNGCSLPRPTRLEKHMDESCIACHMPSKEASIQHTSITDHRIPRHPDADKTSPAATDWPRQGEVPLVPFPAVAAGSEAGSGSRTTSLAEADDEKLSRDLGVALMELGHIHPLPWLGETVLPHLDRAVQDDENDFPAWDARAFALWITGHHEEALACCEKVLEKEPNREATLYTAAMLAIRLNRPALTRSYAERGIKVNPKLWTNYQLLADLAAHGRDWETAKRACQQALRLQPSNILPHRLLITCYLQTGEKTKAQQEFEICMVLTPAEERDKLRLWFTQQTR
ncbi:MAG TPA: hypothetical protein VGX70_05425 [Gemmataceae bacterium]|jgi:hypothetical protein|nr:hypothetical protein [Gemmataceae bacterium]